MIRISIICLYFVFVCSLTQTSKIHAKPRDFTDKQTVHRNTILTKLDGSQWESETIAAAINNRDPEYIKELNSYLASTIEQFYLTKKHQIHRKNNQIRHLYALFFSMNAYLFLGNLSWYGGGKAAYDFTFKPPWQEKTKTILKTVCHSSKTSYQLISNENWSLPKKIVRFSRKIYYAIISSGEIPDWYTPKNISWYQAWEQGQSAAFYTGLDDSWYSSEHIVWDIIGKEVENKYRNKCLSSLKRLEIDKLSDPEIGRLAYRMVEKFSMISFLYSARDFENGILNQIYNNIFENLTDEMIASDPIMANIDTWNKFKANNNLDTSNEFLKYWILEIDKWLVYFDD